MTDFALVPEDSTVVHPDELAVVGAAINLQLAQHVGPAWSKQGTVSTFGSPALVPEKFIPVVVVRDAKNMAGCHSDRNGIKAAIVQYLPDWEWSAAASHEIIETLIDPTFQELVPAIAIQGTHRTVQYLREVCDPCAGETYTITVSREVSVANFCCPAYYGNGSGQVTWMNQESEVSDPWSIGSEGYLTWRDVDGCYYQKTAQGTSGPATLDELLANASKMNLRGAVDRFAGFRHAPHLCPTASHQRSNIEPRSLIKRNRKLAKWLERHWSTKLQ